MERKKKEAQPVAEAIIKQEEQGRNLMLQEPIRKRPAKVTNPIVPTAALAVLTFLLVMPLAAQTDENPASSENGVAEENSAACVSTNQINQPLNRILQALADQCRLTSVMPRRMGGERLSLRAEGVTLEDALLQLFDSTPINYALLCRDSGNDCDLHVYDPRQSGPNQGGQVIRTASQQPQPQPGSAPQAAPGAKPRPGEYLIDLTNLQIEDIEKLRASMGPRELQLLRLFGFDPNKLDNQQILQLVQTLTGSQIQHIEKMGLNPRALSPNDLRRLLFAVPSPKP